MIAYLSGTVLTQTLKRVIVMTSQGVGYRVFMPLSDLAKLSSPHMPISLYIHTHVREDALDLYGFLEEESLQLFEMLIQISGIGPKMALGILSGLDRSSLETALNEGDHTRLTHIPGVGTKTAQRIALELKGKLTLVQKVPSSTHPGLLEDVRLAMVNLGYKAPIIEKALKSLKPTMQPDWDLSTLVKETLSLLSQRNL